MLILFVSPHRNTTKNLEYMLKLTPNNSGCWKNLKGTTDINNFDYIVILDEIDKNLEILGKDSFLKLIKNDLNKVIHFQREHSEIIKFDRKTWYSNEILPKLKNKFFTNKFMYCFIFPSFINKTYDELKKLEFPKKEERLSSITSFKTKSKFKCDYVKRVKFLINYSKNRKIDIYGKGWPKNKLGSNYKGELGSYFKKNVGVTSKFDGLIKYDYSIALENFPNDSIFSEKITDCILSWTIPIYSGNNKLSQYLPEESYHLINLNDKNLISKIDDIIKNKPTEENIKALTEARNLILDKYNIWEQIYQVITNYDNFIRDYSLK